MNIECVLCTYNGAEYIREQLESISHQTCRPDRLIVCDDDSQDSTVEIVADWSRTAGFQVDIFINEPGLGAVGNFEKALFLTTGDYIFFADQDDVWLPEKIELAMKLMKDMESEYGLEMPCLVHTDLMVVDKQLQVIHRSFLENQGLQHIYNEESLLPCLMAQNFVTGCTMLINRALKEKALPFPRDIIMHDYWLALAAAMCGKIGFINVPTILYRQHGRNTVGAVKYLSLGNMLRVFKGEDMLSRIDATVRQLRSAAAYKQGELAAGHSCIGEFLAHIDRHEYLKMLCSSVRKQGFLRNLVYKFYMMVYMAKR